ncbi:phosphoethanolamine transferase [Lelliottia amnigena]|nr:phosphoethanolamine transferase [Lelliottia amnigena]
MKYIKSMTQQKLSFLLALYIGLFMNGAVFFRRFDGYAQDFTVLKGISAVVELVATVLVTFFLLRLLSLFGRRMWRVLASLVVVFSAGASYYMTFMNVVIGYGIIASVMTTDIDLLERGGGSALYSLAGVRERAAAAVHLEQPLPLYFASANAHTWATHPKRYAGGAGRFDGLGADSPAGCEAKIR